MSIESSPIRGVFVGEGCHIDRFFILLMRIEDRQISINHFTESNHHGSISSTAHRPADQTASHCSVSGGLSDTQNQMPRRTRSRLFYRWHSKQHLKRKERHVRSGASHLVAGASARLPLRWWQCRALERRAEPTSLSRRPSAPAN